LRRQLITHVMLFSQENGSRKTFNGGRLAANALLLSIPDCKLDKFASTVKGSYQGVLSASCDAIPLPLGVFDMVTSLEAFAKLDTEKLSQVAKELSATTQASPFSEKGICLPASPVGLGQVWIGQTVLIISIPRAMKQVADWPRQPPC
jgi:hypothetical protein